MNKLRSISEGVLALVLIFALIMAFRLMSSSPALSGLSSRSPVSTPIASSTMLPSNKQTPSVIVSLAPALSIFAPVTDGTPAGVGTISDQKIIPLLYVHDFIFTNAWIQDSQDKSTRTVVYGGYIPGPGGEITQQGVVVIQVLHISSPGNVVVTYYQRFPTSSQSGSVHVINAVGDRLIFQSTTGTTFYFDVPTRQFVPSVDAVVPTLTSDFASPQATPTK